MIRGKKNFIPQTALVFGFGILYKLDDDSIARHKSDRMVKINEEEENEINQVEEEDVEVEIEAGDESESESDEDGQSAFPETSLFTKIVSNLK